MSAPSSRASAIDIGTNSVLLLIADVSGEAKAIVERATITRLGQGVDAHGVLAPEAVARTEACLRKYADEIARHGVERVAVAATSAVRDARNGAAFLERAQAILGVMPEVLSGAHEAELTFEGALMGLTPVQEPVAVFDIGGGSTEIIVGTHAGIERAKSLDIGAVRLTERIVRGDPPSKPELREVREAVDRALRDAPDIVGLPIVGVAGTVTTLAALSLEVSPYDPARIHGAVIETAEIDRIVDWLASMRLVERRALTALDPHRADVIVAGGIIVQAIASAAQAPSLVVSDRGVRWGLIRRLASV